MEEELYKTFSSKRRAKMSLSNKTMPLVVASLLAASTIFGQNQNSCQPKSAPPVCQPVKPTCQPQICKPAKPAVCGVLQEHPVPTIAAYNAPAEINIGMQDEYDFFVTGSFIYWQPLVDNLGLGLSNSTVLEDGVPFTSVRTNVIDMDFNYKPGFQVELGMNLQYDNWVGYAEYTRVHGKHTQSSSTPVTAPNIFATRGHPNLVSSAQLYNSLNASYHCNLDIVDGRMERVYYVGQNLVFHSAWGMRGAWILQKLHTQYVNGSAATTDFGDEFTSQPGVLNEYNRLHTWAVGPSVGLEMDWLLGDGFRFFGSGYGDVLYTKYKVQYKTVFMPTVTGGPFLIGQPITITSRDKVSALRTHVDLEAGLGWGTYLSDNGWHLDFALSYGFQVFFNQNMFMHFNDDVVLGNGSEENGNLYVQGLTATARVDF